MRRCRTSRELNTSSLVAVLKGEAFVGPSLTSVWIKIDAAMLSRETAVPFYGTSAVDYLFGGVNSDHDDAANPSVQLHVFGRPGRCRILHAPRHGASLGPWQVG